MSLLLSLAWFGSVYLDMPVYTNPLSGQEGDEQEEERLVEAPQHKRKGMRITFRVRRL